ncbi:MAG: glycosyltransferase family 25 protein [Saprospiraceae bacterium]|nr:glycosyltransferase family 25 protein [Saprospiraceae bacterium]
MEVKLQVDSVFVVHTRTGLEYRRAFMEEQLGDQGISFEFMLDGDITDLNPTILEKYFAPPMQVYDARTSCALKHFLVLEQVLARRLPSALILEDDAILSENFVQEFNQLILELKGRSDIDEKLAYVCLENSTLEFIPRGQRSARQHLYMAHKTRGSGGYYLTHEVAAKIMDYIHRKRCHTSNDLFFTQLFPLLDIPLFWCHPTLVEQASNNGMWQSSLGNQGHGFWRKLRWRSHKFINTRIRANL